MKIRFGLCLLVAAVATGCSESSSVHTEGILPGQQIALVGGEYLGNFSTSSSPSADFQITLNQNGVNLTGSYRGRNDTVEGTVAGTVGADNFTYTLSQTKPCSGSFSGSGKVNDKSLTASYSGSDCNGAQTGNISVSRQ
ncbi:MAG: hypothetical protein JO102_05225 [Elusimicrobia bacterium]|nr:hypothetical protein [Elusimicrobiota bacterium]